MDDVVHSGELTKAPPLGTGVMSSLKRWQKRHFILRKDAMEYYADSTAQKLLGVIHLPSVTNLQMKCEHPQGKKYEHMFSLICKDRQYLLAADTDDERVEWVTKIRSCLKPETATEDVGQTGDYMNFENVRQYQTERSSMSEGASAAGPAAEGPEEPDNGEGEAVSIGKARVQFDFNPTTPKQLELKAGDTVDVLDNLSLWWVVRRADGMEGLAPSNFLEEVQDMIAKVEVVRGSVPDYIMLMLF